ncbi:hypothetical protein D3C83_36860 [compost metagenome]
MAAIAVAPRAGRLDEAVLLLPGKARLRQQRRHFLQPALERSEIGHDDADVPAQHLGAARRHVNLGAADVDPHVLDASHEIGVARQPQSREVKNGGETLVGNGDVHVLEKHDVPEVLAAAVKRGSHGK